MTKFLKKTSSYILTIAIVGISLTYYCSCSTIKDNYTDNVTKIYLTFNMPVVKLDGELINVEDSLCIYYYKNYVLYQLPNHFSLENENKVILQEIRYNYFIYRKNDKYGYEFNSLNDSVGEKRVVDSLLSKKAFFNTNFYDKKTDSLIKILQYSKANTLLYIYVPKVKYDETYGDTLLLYFTKKLKNVDYTFSKELDSSTNLKLYEIKLLYNKGYSTTYNITLPKREFRFAINELSVNNPQEVKSFCERYEAESKMK